VVVLKTGDEGTVTGASTSLFSSTKLKVSVSGSEHRLSPAELTKKLEVQTAADVMNAVEQAKAAAERAERAAIMAQRHDLGQLSALLETGLAGGASAVDAPLSAAEVAELRSLDPAMLAKVVARHADGEAAQVEVASILESPVLKIYYLTVLATVMSFLTGCEAVHSGIVAKAEWSASDEAGNFMKTALKGGVGAAVKEVRWRKVAAGVVAFAKDQVSGLPFANAVGSILEYLLHAQDDAKQQERVVCAAFFGALATATSEGGSRAVVESAARELTLRRKDALEEEARQEAPQKASSRVKAAKAVFKELLVCSIVHDDEALESLADMAAAEESRVKAAALADATAMCAAITSGRVDGVAQPNMAQHLVELTLGEAVLAPRPEIPHRLPPESLEPSGTNMNPLANGGGGGPLVREVEQFVGKLGLDAGEAARLADVLSDLGLTSMEDIQDPNASLAVQEIQDALTKQGAGLEAKGMALRLRRALAAHLGWQATLPGGADAKAASADMAARLAAMESMVAEEKSRRQSLSVKLEAEKSRREAEEKEARELRLKVLKNGIDVDFFY
jgi:hypothetical protein